VQTIGNASPAVQRIVLFEHDGRETADQFALDHKIDAADVRRGHEASGLLMCGHAHGAAQLTETHDVITTAAHIFYDEQGHLRAPACVYYYQIGKNPFSERIEMSAVVAGSRDPYHEDAAQDWAVARLDHPLAGVKPYRLAARLKDDAAVQFVARGHMDFGRGITTSYESCRTHGVVGESADGTRNLAIDCATAEGSSGGALMAVEADAAAGEPGSLCGVLVGYRSIDPLHPRPFSLQHYNFVVSVEGAFRAAVLAAANRPAIAMAARQVAGKN
jgi:hypothetical protein